MNEKIELQYGQAYSTILGNSRPINVRFFGKLGKVNSNVMRSNVILSVKNGEVVAYRFGEKDLKFENGKLRIIFPETSELYDADKEYLIWLADSKGRTLSKLIKEDFRFNL